MSEPDYTIAGLPAYETGAQDLSDAREHARRVFGDGAHVAASPTDARLYHAECTDVGYVSGVGGTWVVCAMSADDT